MINVTEQALERIKQAKVDEEIKALANGVDPNSLYLRVGILVGGCSGYQYEMAFDHTPIDSEEFILVKDNLKIVVDPESYPHLKDSTIEWKETLMGGGFKIENPNATRQCGCGKSFS